MITNLFADPILHASMVEFTQYMNRFYGPSGIYPTEGRTAPLTVGEVQLAAQLAIASGHNWDCGDTFDREAVRDVLISNGLINPFN